jgi:hypothetical protein
MDFTTTENVQQGKAQFLVNLSVGYNDIFGHGHVTTDCLMYNVATKSWFSSPNPNLHQHN